MAKKETDKGDTLRCSFCGKSQEEVRKLIAGPQVYVCDECVELCNEIMMEEWNEERKREAKPSQKLACSLPIWPRASTAQPPPQCSA